MPPLGTKEYTNYLVNQGNSLGLNLEQYRVPTSASAVQAVPSLNMPTNSPTLGSITEASAGTQGIAEYLTQTAAATDKRIQELDAEQSKARTGLAQYLTSAPSREELRARAEKETGMVSANVFADLQGRIKEIGALEEQYNSVVAARDNEIARIQENGNMTVDGAQVASRAVETKYAIRLNQMSANINARAATLQALQGNYDRAQSYITQAVNDAVADRKDRLQAFSMMYEMNQDTISRLDNRYQDAFKTAISLAQEDYDREFKMKTTLAELQMKYPNSTININGTLDEAFRAIRNSPGGLTPTDDLFSRDDINNGAARAGLTIAQFKTLDQDVQNYFINSTAAQLSNMNDSLKLPNAKELITSSNLPQTVKDYLLGLVPSSTEKESGGFLKKAWQSVTNWLGGAIYNASPDTFNK